MAKRLHSSLILMAVFLLGLGGGVAGMIWAWPGLRARYFRPQRPSFVEYLRESLKLTPDQVTQVQAISKETRDRSQALHLQFVPSYNKVCEDFSQIRTQETAAFAPLRQEELDKMHGVLSAAQWETFQAQRTAAMKRQPPDSRDLCRHLSGAPGGPPPGIGGGGRGGRRGRGGPQVQP